MDANSKAALWAINGVVLNMFGTVIVMFTGAFGMILYGPVWLAGIICGIVGLGYSFAAKSIRIRLLVWSCTLISVLTYIFATELPT